MGCVQSQDMPAKARPSPPKGAPPPASAALAEGPAPAHLHARPASPTAASLPAPLAPAPEPRNTAVLKQAGVFDDLHAEAHRPPELEQVHVQLGKRSSVLLEGFELKEAEARAMPQLVKVDSADLKQSKLYDKLREFEAKDAKAAAEPKLEKTFVQRERENAATTSANAAVASS